MALVPTSAALRLWAPVVLWAAVIFALSSVSDLGTGLGTWDLVLRKLAHAGEFAVLGALLLRALRASNVMRPRRRGALGGARQGRRERRYAGISARLRTPHRAAQRAPAAQRFIALEALWAERPALALGIAYAASDELHQVFVPGRRGSVFDILIDSVGVALGVALWRRLGR